MFTTIFHFEHGFTPFYDLRGYRLFVHISIVFNDFMFTKRANFEEMRKSYFYCMKIALTLFVFLLFDIDKNQFFDFILDKASGVIPK